MQFKNTFLLLFILCFGTTSSAQKYKSLSTAEVSKTLGGSNFTSSKTFFENIEELRILQFWPRYWVAIHFSGTLKNEEMVTFFAVADESFLKLSKKSRDSILGNNKIVSSMLKYLAVPGRVDSNSLKMAVKKNSGKAYMMTLQGENLGIREENGQLVIFDENNKTATIIATDFYHKNGFFHIIDGLVFPSSN